jgi:hypothetical protein
MRQQLTTEPATAVCRNPGCGRRYLLSRHSNQHQYAGKRRVQHSRYCSNACRQAIYRKRQAHSVTPACVTQTPEEGNVPACVTRPLQHIDVKGEFRAQKTVLGIPNGRIEAPQDIIEAEVFGRYRWESCVSSDGVEIEVAQLRPRALVS